MKLIESKLIFPKKIVVTSPSKPLYDGQLFRRQGAFSFGSVCPLVTLKIEPRPQIPNQLFILYQCYIKANLVVPPSFSQSNLSSIKIVGVIYFKMPTIVDVFKLITRSNGIFCCSAHDISSFVHTGLSGYVKLAYLSYTAYVEVIILSRMRERSGSVVECLTGDRRAAGSSLTGVTGLWSLSKTHLS